MKILVTGATGFVGKPLTHALLKKGHSVSVLSRNASRAQKSLSEGIEPSLALKLESFTWDSEKELPPTAALEGVDAVVNLAGESVAGSRWSESVKKRIRDSRVKSTRNLVQALARLTRKPTVFVSASAIGFYGDQKEKALTEDSPQGAGFLASVCHDWEVEAAKADCGRKVTIRIGLVLGPNGGALGKMLPAFKLGGGGKLGHGEQWMSWIARADLVSMFVAAIENPKWQGVYNGASPGPVRNSEFTKTLGHLLHRPTLLTVPSFALRLTFGEMADETLLASQKILPDRIRETDFRFEFQDLKSALENSL